MVYTQLTNSNLKVVSEGMIALASAFDKLEAEGKIRLSTGERCAVVAGMFYAMLEGRLKNKTTAGGLMEVMAHMQEEAKRMHIPEFGGAVRYVQNEL